MTPLPDTTGGRVLSDEQLWQTFEDQLECYFPDSDAVDGHKEDFVAPLRAVESAVIAALSATPLDVEAMLEDCGDAIYDQRAITHDEVASIVDELRPILLRALATQAADFAEKRREFAVQTAALVAADLTRVDTQRDAALAQHADLYSKLCSANARIDELTTSRDKACANYTEAQQRAERLEKSVTYWQGQHDAAEAETLAEKQRAEAAEAMVRELEARLAKVYR